jgi:cysteinyl-tRNA synthetase
LFEAARIVNSVNDGKETITKEDIETLKQLMHNFIFDVMGLEAETSNTSKDKALQGVMEIILNFRKELKVKKDFTASDKLRDELSSLNITIKDTKDGANWSIQE